MKPAADARPSTDQLRDRGLVDRRVKPRLDRRRSLVGSVLLHLGLGLVALRIARHAPPSHTATVVSPLAVEIDFTAPETPPAPAPLPAAATSAPTAATAEPAARPAASAARSNAPAPSSAAPSPSAPSAPAPSTPAPAPVLVAPPAPELHATDLLRVRPSDTVGVWGAAPDVAQVQRDRAIARSLVDLPQGTPESRAAAASQGYVDRQLAGTHQHEAAGVRGYYWSLRRRMVESWRPGVSRIPSIGETLLSTLAMPIAALTDVQRSMAGAAVEPGRTGAAIDMLERNHNAGQLTQQPFTGIIDASRGNTRRTRTEVEVVQGEDGRVVEVRVLHSSRIASFDRAAEQAVREALPLQSPVAMPGGRRSRWSFEIVASRDPFVPGVGFEFDESSGWFELHWPGRAHVRSRVWLEEATPVSRAPSTPRG